jgi:hypothetical protein
MKRLSLFLLFVLALALPAAAHDTSGDLKGFVTSPASPVGGATITATARVGNIERSTTSARNGAYSFSALPAGEYDVSFSKSGMQTLVLRAAVRVARTNELDAHLEPSAEGETVTRTQTAPSILADAVVATTFEAALIDVLPLSRTNSSRIALAPGYATTPFADVMHGIGDVTRTVGSAPASSYDVNEVRDALDETSVLTAALPAEYGGGRAAFAITTLRRGGDDWEGSLRIDLTSSRWSAGRAPGYDDGITPLIELTAGGPLITDHLSIFSALAYENRSIRYQTPSGAGTEELRARSAAVRLDGAVTAAQSIIVNGRWGREHLSSRFDEPLGYTYRNVDDDRSFAAEYDAQWGSRWSSDVMAAERRSGCAGVCPVVTPQRELHAQLWHSMEGPFGRLHTITAGYEHATSDSLVLNGASRNDAFFLEDRWDVAPRLALRGGVRVETHDASDRGTHVLPRLAAVYDLKHNGRERLSASFSQYDVRATDVRPIFLPVSFSGRIVSEATVAFGSLIASAGSASVTYVHRWVGANDARQTIDLPRHYDGLELSADYRFLTFLRVGGNYTYATRDLPIAAPDPASATPRLFSHDRANAWAVASLPLPFGSLALSLLERYRSDIAMTYLFAARPPDPTPSRQSGSIVQTDLATIYTFPVRTTELFVRGDLLNAFDGATPAAPTSDELLRRTVRFAVGAHF